MSDKPTGVFVRLPLSEERAITFHKESSHAWDEFNGSSNALACEAGLFAIGTPVAGGDIPIIGTIHIGENGKPFFTAPELYSVGGDVVRQSDAQAQIAALEAEVERLRHHLERIDHLIMGNSDPVMMFCGIHASCTEALKGGTA